MKTFFWSILVWLSFFTRVVKIFPKVKKLSSKSTKKKINSTTIDILGLQKLHDNLSQDYDKILKERDSSKDVEKQLRDEIRRLEVWITLNFKS